MSDILHVYENDVPESIVAYSPEDAEKVWAETVGEPYDPEECGDKFYQVPDGKVITVIVEDGYINLPAGTYKKTAREWADFSGRSYLCSAEY